MGSIPQMNSFTARMSAVAYEGTTSIHPNGRNVKQYKVGTGKKRRKAIKRLSIRQTNYPESKPGYKRPGSMQIR